MLKTGKDRGNAGAGNTGKVGAGEVDTGSTGEVGTGSAQLLTFRFRLNTTRSQRNALGKALDHSRDLYNCALEERIDCYRKTGKSRSWQDQYKELTELREDKTFTNYAVAMQRWPLKRLNEAFAAFFRRVKAGEKPGFPRFRSATRYDSLGFSDKSGWQVKGKRLRMKGIGSIRLHMHRPLPSKPVALSITRKADIWYANLVASVPCSTSHNGGRIGLDAGCVNLATLSDGSVIPRIRHDKARAKRTRRLRRALARCKRGSRNRRKARERLARVKMAEANARKTYLHQITARLVQQHSIIAVEDLSIKNMTAKGGSHKTGLNRSIQDAAWGKMTLYLEYKAERAGGKVVKVCPKYTSQTCAVCGHVSRDNRKTQARFECLQCGHSDNADVNAAKIIAMHSDVVVAGVPQS